MTIYLKPIIIKAVQAVPEVLPLLSGEARAYIAGQTVKAAGDYQSIRDRLYNAIVDTVSVYLSGHGNVTGPKQAFTTALAQAYTEGADAAYVDGGGELPLDPDTASMVRGLLDAQFGFADALFETLKALRKEGDFDAQAEAEKRAEGYCQSLDGMYGQVRLMAAGNKMLTFDGTDGDANHICQSIGGTCVRLKGQRHRASWWLAHDLVPYPGNKNYDCGAWRCQHYLIDDEGVKYTL